MASRTYEPAVSSAPKIVPATAPVISVQNVVHRYEQRTALDGVSFDVQAAELFGLLGPNGSGKTTLFRILSTLMVPVGGHASILGFDVARDPNGLRRQIGVVFQAQSIDLKLTAAENLMHQGHLYGLHGGPLKARIAEMLGRVGLADRAREKAESFSGGMQRRLELAKGLLHHPSVLLLDEPTRSLDAAATGSFWTAVRTLARRNTTVFVATHNFAEAAALASRVLLLHRGVLLADRPCGLHLSTARAVDELRELYFRLTGSDASGEAESEEDFEESLARSAGVAS